MKGTYSYTHSRRRTAEKKLWPTVPSGGVCGLHICISISDDDKELLVKAHTAVNRSWLTRFKDSSESIAGI